ncbi:MAG: hypothetical protein CR997_11850 [Acidobacteria bacterium]|nr:MAG: hypothetical protein CR997_11850 [Acidobacteriota bacterium]
MWIKELNYTHFRNLQSNQLHLKPGISVFYGVNGQGKTNILESVYTLLTSRSFRTHNLIDCISFGNKYMNISGILMKKHMAWSMEFQYRNKGSARFINSKKEKTLDYLKVGSVLIFHAASKRIILGSPDDRRRLLDQLIGMGDSRYLSLLSQYRRNRQNLKKILLSHHPDRHLYKSFKQTLLPIACELITKRIEYIARIQPYFNSIYRDVFSENERVYLKYQIKNSVDRDSYEKRFIESSPKELLYKRQLMGPHLDDLLFYMNDSPSRKFSSSGQIRSMILALLCAARKKEFMENQLYPIFLLDDIRSELDQKRLSKLMHYLGDKGQILISSTKYAKIDHSCLSSGFEVKNGTIHPLG